MRKKLERGCSHKRSWTYDSPHVREFRTVLDSGFQYLSVELGFWIPIVSGIPDSFSCILDSKPQDCGFHNQNFPGFQIPQAKISQILESLIWGDMTFCCQYTSSTLVDSRTGYQTWDHNIVAVDLVRGSHIVIWKARPMIGLTRRNFLACSRGTNTDWNSKLSQILVPFQVDSVPFFTMSVWCLIED